MMGGVYISLCRGETLQTLIPGIGGNCNSCGTWLVWGGLNFREAVVEMGRHWICAGLLAIAGLAASSLPAADKPEVTTAAEIEAILKSVTREEPKKAVVKRKKRRRAVKKTKRPTTSAVQPPAVPEGRLTVQQVMDALKSPARDLSGRDMSGLKLSGVSLVRTNLKGTNLSRANLERADLEEANLERTNLADADLRMANLRLCGINATNFERAVLDGAIWKDGRICGPGSIGECRDALLAPLPALVPPVTPPAAPPESAPPSVPPSPPSAAAPPAPLPQPPTPEKH